ncbi:MAG: YHS domain-containing protein [Flavobacteriales bacterium]|nr:YHS domain-containing protein [Flavobacteriales bacterium]
MKYLKWIGVLLGTVLILLFGSYLYYFEILEDDYFNINASQYLVNENQIAVNGYDLTEYFTSNRAVKGDTTYLLKYDGAKYLFASEENLLLFKEHPQNFLPQYGGYCAFGLGMEAGEGIGMNKPGKYPSTPSSFKVVNNKLYLFFDSSIFHAKEKWEKNESKFINNANSAWKEMKK